MAATFGLNVGPLANKTPLAADPYQPIVPALAVATSVTVPEPHRFAGVVAVIVGVALTVAMTAVRCERQLPFAAST